VPAIFMNPRRSNGVLFAINVSFEVWNGCLAAMRAWLHLDTDRCGIWRIGSKVACILNNHAHGLLHWVFVRSLSS
jgi:hypothetical protein